MKKKGLKREELAKSRIIGAFQDRIQRNLLRKEILRLLREGLLFASPFIGFAAYDYFRNQPGFTHDLINYLITQAHYLLEPEPALQNNVPRLFNEIYRPLFISSVTGGSMAVLLGLWGINNLASNAYTTRNKIMENIFRAPQDSKESEFDIFHKYTKGGKREWRRALKEYFQVQTQWANIENVALLAKDDNIHLTTKYLRPISPRTYIRPTLDQIVNGLNERDDRPEMEKPRGRRTRVTFALPQQPNQPKMYFDGYVYRNPYKNKPQPHEFLGFEVIVKKLSDDEWVFGTIGPKPKKEPKGLEQTFYSQQIKKKILKPIYYSTPPKGAKRIALVFEGTYPTAKGGVASVAHAMIRDFKKEDFKSKEYPDGQEPFYEVVTLQGFTGPFKTKIAYKLFDNTHLNPPIMLFGHTNNPALDAKSTLEGKLFSERKWWETKSSHRKKELRSVIKDLETAIDEGRMDLFYDVSDRIQFFSSDELLRSQTTFEVLYELYHQDKDHQKIDFRRYTYYWRDLRQQLISVIKSEKVEADVYYTLLTGTAGVYAALAKRHFAKQNKNVPILLTEHGIYNVDRKIDFVNSPMPASIRRKWNKTLDFYSKVSYESADRITTLCKRNQKKQEAAGADPNIIEIVPGGIPWKTGPYKKDHPGLEDAQSFRVGLLANVQPVKRVELYIQVAKYLLEHYPKIKWDFHVMGGFDPDVKDYGLAVQNMVKEAPELHGVFHFSKYEGDYREAMAPLDVGVLTSSSEVMSMSIMEALSIGKPVVAYDVGGNAELITGGEYDEFGDCGIVLPVDTMENQKISMANAILTLYLRKHKMLHPDMPLPYDPPDPSQLEDLLKNDFDQIGPKRIRSRYCTLETNKRMAANLAFNMAAC